MKIIVKIWVLMMVVGIWACRGSVEESDQKKKSNNNIIHDTSRATKNIFDDISDEIRESIPNKTVRGREYYYENSRYKYNDPTQTWYIYERPKGIHTYRYLNIDENVSNDIDAFKIEFMDDSGHLIKVIELGKTNPYTDKSNSKYLGEGRPSFQERAYSNLISKEYVNLLEVAHEYYTISHVWESSDNYVIIDYCMVGRDQKHRYIGEEHTWVIIDNKGNEIAKIDKLYGWNRDGILSKNKKILIFLQGDYRSFEKQLLKIWDIEKNQIIYSSNKMNESYSTLTRVDFANSDEYLTLGIDHNYQGKTSSRIRKYINVDKREILTRVFTEDEEFSISEYYKNYYENNDGKIDWIITNFMYSIEIF